MDERNTVGAIMSTALSCISDFVEPLKWFFLLGLLLTFADLKFGIEAAKFRKENIRTSRAVRRTLNKVVDYLCWIFVSGALGEAFGVPFDITYIPAAVMFVVYGIELNSCFGNYFEARGKKYHFNIFKLFKNKVIEEEGIKEENEIKTVENEK